MIAKKIICLSMALLPFVSFADSSGRKIAQEASRPERPAALAATGPVDATTKKNTSSSGRMFCRSLKEISDRGLMGKPKCQKTIDSATAASSEMCNGDEFVGFKGFNELETITLQVLYTKLVASDFSLGMMACGHPFAQTTQVGTDFASSNSESFFGVGTGGKFQKLVRTDGSDGALVKIRAEWNVYARALYDFLKRVP